MDEVWFFWSLRDFDFGREDPRSRSKLKLDLDLDLL
jgi:hypothetical protein